MFGFLRRKKPAPVAQVTETAAGTPVPETDAGAAPESALAPDDGSSPADDPSLLREAERHPAEEDVADAADALVAGVAAADTADTAGTTDAPDTAITAGSASSAGTAGLAAQPQHASWMARLRQGLSKTRGNLAGLFVGTKIDDALFEELETALLLSDAGVETTNHLMQSLRERIRRERIETAEGVRGALRSIVAELLRPLERPIDIDAAEPLVVMIAGVNGAGKTTSIGKLAKHLQREGKSVLLAAGDTFRAAAREQLTEWGSRNNVQVIAQQGGDPAAVAFDAVSAARARRIGVVMVDTAGRLPTQLHLMDELKKIRRVIGKAMDGAPHETLIVLDGNTGQNMLAQVRAFDDAIGVTGLIVTKLDGTAKGGTLAALAWTRRERPIPVCFIGVGEGIDDLQGFSADEFASALLD